MKKVLIVSFGNTGNEAEALRQVLESFGTFVATKYIGRPNDFADVLSGKLPIDADALIFSCHGDEGAFVMPVLGESVYFDGEVRTNFSSREIKEYLKLENKLILSLGCTTGCHEMMEAFAKNNTYIAPRDYVDGRSALFFAVKFFYELVQNERTVKEACLLAKQTDTETDFFEIGE